MTMKRILSLALPLLISSAAVHAQQLVYEHDDKPLFSIELPDGWDIDLDFKAEAIEAGTYVEGEPLQIQIVEANPSDGAHLWIGLWAVPDASTLDEGIEYLQSLNADLFPDLTLSDPEQRDLNGMVARVATGTATLDSEPVEMIIALFQPRASAVAVGLYVGAVDVWQGYVAEREAMVASLAPAG
jgi:hypothetical protein